MKPDGISIEPMLRRQRLERALVALSTMALTLVLVIDVMTGEDGWPRVVVGGLAAILAVLASGRSANVAAGALVTLSLAFSIGGALLSNGDSTPGLALNCGLVLMGGIVVRSGGRPWAFLVVAGIFLATLLANLVFVDPFVGLVLTIIFWVVAAISVAAGFYVRLGEEERDRSVTRARNSERLEMARELHDVVAHHVTGIVVQAQAGQFVAETDPHQAKQILVEIEQAGAHAMASMRQLVETLRTGESPVEVSMNAQADLDDIARSIRESGIEANLAVGAFPDALAPTIVRLTREAVTNVRRHGLNATVIDIVVSADDTALYWSVSDNGRPTAHNPNPGYGLVGMRERVESLRGQFQVGHDGERWTVSANFPMRPTR